MCLSIGRLYHWQAGRLSRLHQMMRGISGCATRRGNRLRHGLQRDVMRLSRRARDGDQVRRGEMRLLLRLLMLLMLLVLLRDFDGVVMLDDGIEDVRVLADGMWRS